MLKKIMFSTTVTTLLFTNLNANNIEQKFTDLLYKHNLIKSAKENVKSARSKVEVEEAAWYPDISLTVEAGRDNYERSNSANTHQSTRASTVKLEQLLYDFGATSSSIRKSEHGLTKAEAELERQKQYLILSGLEAMIDLYSNTKKYQFAKESEENIMKQTKLESARIRAGVGYTTDLLQAKSQLASAEAKRVEAEANLEKSKNRYSAVFKSNDYNVSEVVIKNIDDLVPESLEIALIEAMRVNPDLKVFKSDSLIAKSEVIRVRRSEWAPKLSFVAKYVDEHNPSGSTFDKEEANFGVRFTWNFNTGLRASKAEAVARHNSLSADEELQNSKSGISESTKNAWAELESAKKRSKYLGNQASILEQFLELARKERELGKRSLLDVLTAETSLVNAKSDKMIADSEVLKAQLNLLLQISKLDISILR